MLSSGLAAKKKRGAPGRAPLRGVAIYEEEYACTRLCGVPCMFHILPHPPPDFVTSPLTFCELWGAVAKTARLGLPWQSDEIWCSLAKRRDSVLFDKATELGLLPDGLYGIQNSVRSVLLGGQGDVSIRPPRPLTTPYPLNEQGSCHSLASPRMHLLLESLVLVRAE